jgi:hypothetical protein
MKITFPKITKDFSCTEYAPEAEITFTVWVNPPTKLLSDLSDAYTAYAEKGEEGREMFMPLLAEILSQGDNTWTPDELKELQDGVADTDPMFWHWLQDRILKEIREHRIVLKKT